MGCKVCESITEYTENGYPQDFESILVYNKETDTFDLWWDGGGDSFVCCVYLEDIKYCPKCGRKLKGGD